MIIYRIWWIVGYGRWRSRRRSGIGGGGGDGVRGISVIRLNCLMEIRMHGRLPAFTHGIMSARCQLMFGRMMMMMIVMMMLMIARCNRCT